ncbi:hypothetical protein BH11BAC5_BH11BAC5_07790 [soil metagenome]|jgi:hypothetical protein
MAQCKSLIDALSENGEDLQLDNSSEQLKGDLERLQQLMTAYIGIVSALPALSNEYNGLQRIIRIRVRKMQIQKNKPFLNR